MRTKDRGSIDESVNNSNEEIFMGKFIRGDVEYVNGTPAMRITEQGRANKDTAEVADVKVILDNKEGMDEQKPKGLEQIEDIFMQWEGGE